MISWEAGAGQLLYCIVISSLAREGVKQAGHGGE